MWFLAAELSVKMINVNDDSDMITKNDSVRIDDVGEKMRKSASASGFTVSWVRARLQLVQILAPGIFCGPSRGEEGLARLANGIF